MSGLRGEAKNLREALKLDPTNTGKMAQLQKNLQTQLGLSRDKATKLKQELSSVDKSSPEGQKKWLQLTRDLGTAETQANKLEGEIKQVEGAISSGSWDIDAKMDTKGVNSGIEGMKSRFSGLREIAVGAFRQIGSSAVSAVSNGLKGWVSDAMDTQKAMISLQNTMKFKGSGQEFDYVSKSMQNLAKDTNANTEDTIKLSTTFIGLGDTAKSAVGKTEALVKANQAFGGTGEQLKGVVQAYGQMSASGKVTAENINQLTDNNTALGSALKSTVMEMNPALKQYGSFAGASEKGAISVEMLDKAMQKLGKAGGGGVTTIGDAWDSFNETLSLALLPTLDALTPIISGLIDKMSGWGESAGKTITNVIKYFQDLFQKLQENAATLAFLEAWDNMKSAFDSIVSIIGNVINSFLGINKETTKSATSIDNVAKSIAIFAGKFSEVTKKIADFLKKISESKTAMSVLKGTLVVLASAFVALKVISGIVKAFEIYNKIVEAGTIIQGAFNAIMAINPFVALGIAIAAIVAGLVYFFAQTETGKKAWASFVDFLKSAWDGIVSFFSGMGQWFSDIWNGAVDGAKSIWQGLVDWFTGIVQGIQNIWNGITTFFTTLWTTVVTEIQTAWAGVTEFFTTLWTNISNVATTVWTAIETFLGTVVTSIMNFFRPLIQFYQSLWNLIFSIIDLVIKLILAGIRGLVQGIVDLWNGLIGVVQTVWNAILGFIKVVISGIQSAMQVMGNFINGIWTAIKNFFTPIFQAIGSFAGQVFQGISNVASSVWNTIKGVWGAVTGFFSGIFNTVKSVVSSAFSALGGFASNAWNAITGVFSSVGSWFGGVFDSAKEAVSNALGALGDIAKGAWDSITSVFSGVYDFFAGAFGGVKNLIDGILGGISGTLDTISRAINGVSKTAGGLFKGSTVQSISDFNLRGSETTGMTKNSASNDNRVYNTFTINAGNQEVTTLARAIRREFDQGRA
jgi:tape measure domain-containing protein